MSVPGVVALGGRILRQPVVGVPPDVWERLGRADRYELQDLAWTLLVVFGSDEALRTLNAELLSRPERLVWADGRLQDRAALVLTLARLVATGDGLKLPARARLLQVIVREACCRPDLEAA